ncbi:MAG: TIGR00341 family protein [Candidatus Paceibacterota bacterium]
MFESLFNNLDEKDKNAAIENIIQHASPRTDFFLMLMLSISMAVFGILLGSSVILIGSMLIAPILYPVLSLSLGVIVSDSKLIARSFFTLLKSVGIGLMAGLVIGLLFAGVANGEMLPLSIYMEGSTSFMYTTVAIIAGFAAAFAITKPHLNETLPGVAIAVALVPPLATAGVGLAMFDWAMISSALLLFFVNVVGIMFSAMVVFAMFKFSFKRRVTEEAVRNDEKEIKEETGS